MLAVVLSPDCKPFQQISIIHYHQWRDARRDGWREMRIGQRRERIWGEKTNNGRTQKATEPMNIMVKDGWVHEDEQMEGLGGGKRSQNEAETKTDINSETERQRLILTTPLLFAGVMVGVGKRWETRQTDQERKMSDRDLSPLLFYCHPHRLLSPPPTPSHLVRSHIFSSDSHVIFIFWSNGGGPPRRSELFEERHNKHKTPSRSPPCCLGPH